MSRLRETRRTMASRPRDGRTRYDPEAAGDGEYVDLPWQAWAFAALAVGFFIAVGALLGRAWC